MITLWLASGVLGKGADVVQAVGAGGGGYARGIGDSPKRRERILADLADEERKRRKRRRGKKKKREEVIAVPVSDDGPVWLPAPVNDDDDTRDIEDIMDILAILEAA